MVKNNVLDAPIYSTALSAREVSLLSNWERERRIVVSLADIQKKVGAKAAIDVARNLVRKHALERIRRGTYLVRTFRSLGRPTQRSTAFMVEALLLNEPHYVGGLWAVSFHGFSEQKYTSVLDAFVAHRLSPRLLGAGRVRFHVLSKASFDYGVQTTAIEGLNVHISDKERTLLDAFDHPRLFGGVERALELARIQLKNVDLLKVVSYAIAGSKPTTCQRLGVLLERQRLTDRALRKLRTKTREAQSLLSLNPEAPRVGPINRNWNIVENDK